MTWRITPHILKGKGRVTGTPVTLQPTGYEKRGGGAGGWETLDRPRQDPAVAWVGSPAETLELPAMLNGIEAGGVGTDVPQDGYCTLVESWGRKAGAGGEPPILQVAGVVGVPTTHRWVVQDIAWGECIVDWAGRRIQQEVTLTLQRWIEPTLIRSPAAKARSKGKGKKGGKGKPKKGGKKK